MTAETTPSPVESEERLHPDIGPNLFWDDYRIGLQVLCGGVGILLIAFVAALAALPFWLVVGLAAIGGLVTVNGVKICCGVPEETGGNLLALGALGFGGLCLLACAVSLIPVSGLAIAARIGVFLGAVSHILLAVVLWKSAQYLRLVNLGFTTGVYVVLAAAYSLTMAILVLTGATAAVQVQLLCFLATLIVVAFLCFNALGLSMAIARGQQGLPLESAPEEIHTPEADTEERLPETGTDIEFSESEAAVLRKSDVGAAGAIVGLMTAVFSVGMLIYTIIAITVGS